MKLYNCYAKHDKHSKIEDLKAIEEKFSFAAFFFNCFFGIWFLYHRMWREAICLITVVFFASLVSHFIFNFDNFYLEISLYFIAALNCKTWLGEHLVRNRGYKFLGMVFANDREQAITKIIEQANYKNPDYSQQISKKIFYPEKFKRFSYKILPFNPSKILQKTQKIKIVNENNNN